MVLASLVPVLVGYSVLLNTAHPILVALTKDDSGKLGYSTPVFTFLAELLKFVASVFLGTANVGDGGEKRLAVDDDDNSGSFSCLSKQKLRSFIWYALPSVFYAISNNAAVHVVLLLGPEVFVVLGNTSLLMSAFLGRVFLHQKLKRLQVFALLVVFLACVVSKLGTIVCTTSSNGRTPAAAKPRGLIEKTRSLWVESAGKRRDDHEDSTRWWAAWEGAELPTQQLLLPDEVEIGILRSEAAGDDVFRQERQLADAGAPDASTEASAAGLKTLFAGLIWLALYATFTSAGGVASEYLLRVSDVQSGTWEKNALFAIWGMAFNAVLVVFETAAAAAATPYPPPPTSLSTPSTSVSLLRGFKTMTWVAIVSAALGGLSVSLVLRHLGNLVKCLIKISTTFAVAFLWWLFFRGKMDLCYFVGMALLILGLLLYSQWQLFAVPDAEGVPAAATAQSSSPTSKADVQAGRAAAAQADDIPSDEDADDEASRLAAEQVAVHIDDGNVSVAREVRGNKRLHIFEHAGGGTKKIGMNYAPVAQQVPDAAALARSGREDDQHMIELGRIKPTGLVGMGKTITKIIHHRSREDGL